MNNCTGVYNCDNNALIVIIDIGQDEIVEGIHRTVNRQHFSC